MAAALPSSQEAEVTCPTTSNCAISSRPMKSFVVLFAFLLAPFSGCTAETQVAYPRVLEEQKTNGTIAVQVTENVRLNLRKAALTLSRVRLDVETNGTLVHKVINGSQIEENLYVDPKQRSSVIMYQDKEGITLTGMVSDTLRIRPLAPKARILQLRGMHALDKIDKTQVEDAADKVVVRDGLSTVLAASSSKKHLRHRIVYPEVYAVVGLNYAKGASDTNLLSYLIIFLTGVNLKLAELVDPQVQLRLVGVLRSATLDKSLQRRGSFVLALSTVNTFIRQAANLGVGDPDIFLLLTEEDLTDLMNGKYESRITGVSPIGGMCIPARNALIVEDVYGSYSGNDVAAHEIAHMLGAPHDDFGPPYQDICGWHLGYIMSYLDGGEKKHHFSPCSRDLIQKSLSQKDERCLKLTFIDDYITYLPGVLPGKLFDGDIFCQAQHRDLPGVFFPVQSPKTLQQCRLTCNGPQDMDGGYTYFTHQAPEGTPCYAKVSSAVCELGRCVQME